MKTEDIKNALGAHVALAHGIVTILVVTPMLGFAIVQIRSARAVPLRPRAFACVPTTLTSGVTLVTARRAARSRSCSR